MKSLTETETHYDESRVPDYVLPDPLRFADGRAVTAAMWPQRRQELLTLFQQHIYGTPPEVDPAFELEFGAVHALPGGLGDWRELTLRFGGSPAVSMVLFLPSHPRPAPVFVGLNFYGNHTVWPDPLIALPQGWVPQRPRLGVDGHTATPASRGCLAARWPVEMLLARGYGLATAYAGDFDPDDDGFAGGLHALDAGPRTETSGGNISAWAWGLSRLLDALQQLPEVDAKRVASVGHSRMGKTALWAAAQDERFALAVSNESGCLGAALSRRRFGETVARIYGQFPHWFCAKCRDYAENEEALPIDQHELLALIAPRPVYVAGAAQDQWADPRGEFLACRAATPVYQLLGRRGLAGAEMPELNVSVGDDIGYHIRPGEHDLTPADWWHYLAFADRVWER